MDILDPQAGRLRFDPFQPESMARDPETLAIFAVCVAGKRADQTVRKVHELMSVCLPCFSPLDYVERLILRGVLDRELRRVKMGQYSRIGKALCALVVDRRCFGSLLAAPLLALETSMGPKSARFFAAYARNERVAILDTHILRHMREELGWDVPTSTPTRAKYREIEERWLAHLDALKLDPVEADFAVWTSRAKRAA